MQHLEFLVSAPGKNEGKKLFYETGMEKSRVTRLGDLSPVGRLFTFGRFLKIRYIFE
jgi:hypothetical protein